MSQDNILLFPDTDIGQITKDTLVDLIESSLDEGYTFELKESVKDPKIKIDVREAMASLANLNGGFLIIGLKDKKNSPGKENDTDYRMVGIEDPNLEPNKWVDDICAKELIKPTPRFETKKIELSDKKYVLVIKIYPYQLGPIAFRSEQSKPLVFKQRGNGANRDMGYTDIGRKFASSESGKLKAAVVDLITQFGIWDNIGKIKSVEALMFERPSSIIVDDRQHYLGLMNGSLGFTNSLYNLKRMEDMVNEAFGFFGAMHIEQKVIGNKTEALSCITNCSAIAHKSIVEIFIELIDHYREVVAPILEDWSKYDEKIKPIIEKR